MKIKLGIIWSSLIVGLLASCTSTEQSATIPEIEAVLGKGWVCHSAPDGLKKAGVVIQKTKEGSFVFEGDFSSSSIETNSVIGGLTYQSKTSLGGMLKLLEQLDIVDANSEITGVMSAVANINVQYDDTKKHVISGDHAREVAKAYQQKNLKSSSRYYIIRESHAAKAIDISVDKTFVSKLGVDVEINKVIDTNPSINNKSDSKYTLKKSFDQRIGVCTVMTELEVSHGVDGSIRVVAGHNYDMSRDIEIEIKD